MGISVICAYDAAEDRYRVFMGDNIRQFQDLADRTDLLVGFNSAAFDDMLCSVNGIHVDTDYDIQREFYIAKGLEPYPERYDARYKGMSLDGICKANLKISKTGNGAMAPVLWQKGKIGQVIDYCLMDVRLCVGLMQKITSGNQLICPVDGKKYRLREPLCEWE